jgi:hypothetical protein
MAWATHFGFSSTVGRWRSCGRCLASTIAAQVLLCNSVARWRFSLPDFKILADLKVVWRAKNISGRLPISGGFEQYLMDLFLSG